MHVITRRVSPCQKLKFSDSAWQAEMGGWWQTCYDNKRNKSEKTLQIQYIQLWQRCHTLEQSAIINIIILVTPVFDI